MAKKLVVLAGPDEGRTLSLGQDVMMLGRSRATEHPLIDPHVAPVHCEIQPENGHLVLVDHDSMSGTFVNGKEVARHVLREGDLIRIGNTHLQFIDDAPSTSTSAPPTIAMPVKSAAHAKPSMAWATPLVNSVLAHYEIGSVLGRGKTGVVFHARDTHNDTAVILKVLQPEFGQDDRKVHYFVEAMKAVLPLSHPNLLRIFGAGKTGPHCWLAMEYSPSESLSAVIGRIEKAGKVDWKLVVRISAYLARALEYAHSKDLIHQNVTPQNILIGRKLQNTKLTDLMLAKATEEDPTRPISAAGLPSDSLFFMSPERTDGPEGRVDSRTDLYSLGATIFAMLTGKPPFSGATVAETIEKIRLDAPPHLHAINPNIPNELAKLLRRCLAKRPQDRPQTAGDLRKKLESIAQSENVVL